MPFESLKLYMSSFMYVYPWYSKSMFILFAGCLLYPWEHGPTILIAGGWDFHLSVSFVIII